MWSMGLTLMALLSFLVSAVVAEPLCPPDKLQGCLSMAYKFLENDRFTFPTTKGDVEDVCNSWSRFLECIESYVADCLDMRQKNEFKQSVDSILESVRNLCTDANYQEQYFKHAECIKRTCTDDLYCGRHYKQLTRQVSQDFDANELCCNYRQFDNCVVINTNAICGSTARDFASAMLNKAMSFLATRCQVTSQSLDGCVEVVVAGVSEGSATNLAPPGSRALPNALQSPQSTTSRWSPTKEPESMAYENGHSTITRSSTSLVIVITFISLVIKLI